MEYLQFKVDGEFVCKLARTWFWDENRPYEKCEELLLSCLGTDEITSEEKKEIVVEILEGKLKLVGINVCQLVEDGENVRKLSEKKKEYERDKCIREIIEDKKIHPILYIDKFAARKELNDYNNYLQVTRNKDSTDNIIWWLYSSYNSWKDSYSLNEEQLNEESGLRRGAYLMDEYLVYDLFKKPLSNVEENEKYEKLFHYIEQLDSSNENFFRQNLYLAYLRKCETKRDSHEQNRFDREICYVTDPDEFISPYGLIDPDGNYYSCGFGGHGVKAYSLIKRYPERFDMDKESVKEFLSTGDESEILYEKGWLIVHNTSMMGDPYFKVNPNIEVTGQQVKRAFDYMAHFNRMDMRCVEDLIENVVSRRK